MNTTYDHIVHPFPPLYDENSEILILGSLPSVKSREQKVLGIEANVLPSTSPANAAYSVERLVENWRIILDA